MVCGCLKFSGVTRKPVPPFHGNVLSAPPTNRDFTFPTCDGGSFGWLDFVVPATYAGGGLTIKVKAFTEAAAGSSPGWIGLCATQMGSDLASMGNITDCPEDMGEGYFPGTAWYQYVTVTSFDGSDTFQAFNISRTPTVYDFAIPASCNALPIIGSGPTGGGQTLAIGLDAGLYFVDNTGTGFGSLAYFPQYQGVNGAYLATELAAGSHSYVAGDAMSLQLYGGAFTGNGNTNIASITVSDGVTDTDLDLSLTTVGFGVGLSLEWNPQKLVGGVPTSPPLNDWLFRTI